MKIDRKNVALIPQSTNPAHLPQVYDNIEKRATENALKDLAKNRAVLEKDLDSCLIRKGDADRRLKHETT